MICHRSSSANQLNELSRDSELEVRQFELFNWHKTIRNNITLLTIFNVICIIGNTFAITFYEWYEIGPDSATNQKSTWLNMLYVYDEEERKYLSFQVYSHEQHNICQKIVDPSQGTTSDCQKEMNTLFLVGMVCFFLLFSSLIIQVLDIFRLRRMLLYIEERKEIQNKIKGSFIYTLVCVGQIGALLTYFITIICFQDHRFSVGNFGVSYWISVFCSVSMVIFALYYKWSKNCYHQFLESDKWQNLEFLVK